MVDVSCIKHKLVGISTPLKNISQLGLLCPIYGKIKHVPKHQPVKIIPRDPPNPPDRLHGTGDFQRTGPAL